MSQTIRSEKSVTNIRATISHQHPRYKFIASLPKDAVVLDIGCGKGAMQKKLKMYRQDLKFIFVDKCDFSKEYPSGTFFSLDISNEVLPIKSETIDAVFCSHVFEHLYSHDLVLSEIRRVLKPTGKIYIEVPSTRSLYLPSLGFFRGQDAPINFYDDPTHVRPFTRQSLHIIGKKLGFRKIKTGFARNWLYCLLAPIILPYSIIKKDRQMFAIILWNITGWCIYLWGEGVDK